MTPTNSCYGWVLLSPTALGRRVGHLVKKMREVKETVGFDAIAFRGSSGAAAAFYASIKLKVPLIYVRKADESPHGGDIEFTKGASPIRSYVIVDDFIESGSTMRTIIRKLWDYARSRRETPARCVAIFLYEDIGGGSIVDVDADGRFPCDADKNVQFIPCYLGKRRRWLGDAPMVSS